MRTRLPFTMVWALLLLVPVSTRGAIPGADDPNVLTEREVRKALLEYNRRTTVEVYRQHGQRDPKWDEATIAALDGLALFFSNSSAGIYYNPDAPRLPQLGALVDTAVNAGSPDPMITYARGLVLNLSNKPAEARPFVKQALDGLLESPYPVTRACSAASRLLALIDKDKEKEEHERVRAIVWDACLATASTEMAGIEPRLVLRTLGHTVEAMPVEDQEKLYREMQVVKANPWLTLMIGGRYHVSAAWKARGGGWASEVTEAGWAGFRKHLDEANDCFTQAWKRHPEFPEAATEMITVAMGQDTGDQRLWFDRAVTGQFDHNEAYMKFLYSIWPRWGGSFEEMYAFGLECAQTKRYDTHVPYVLVTALEQISKDSDRSLEFWRLDGVYENLRTVLEQVPPDPEAGMDRTAFLSYLASIAAELNEYDDARRLLDQLGDQLNLVQFKRRTTLPRRTISGVYAVTGPHGEALRQANDAVAAGKLEEAKAVFAKAAAEVDPADPGAAYIRGRVAELDWMIQLKTGDWVDIQPDAQLAGWYPLGGTWTHENGALVLNHVNGEITALVCGVPIQGNYEMRGVIEFIGADAKQGEGGSAIMPIFAGEPYSCALWMVPAKSRIVLRTAFKYEERFQAELAQRVPFHVIVLDGTLTLGSGDTVLLNRHKIWRPVAEQETVRVAVGGNERSNQSSARFTELQIRLVE